MNLELLLKSKVNSFLFLSSSGEERCDTDHYIPGSSVLNERGYYKKLFVYRANCMLGQVF